MGKNASGSQFLDFADRMFLEFLRSLPSGSECLIELNHWRFFLFGEIEFLDEFSLLTGTRNWMLSSILSTSFKTVGHTGLSFWTMFVAFGKKSQELFFFHWFAILKCFCMEQRFFARDGWVFLLTLNDKCARVLRFACVQLHGKQLSRALLLDQFFWY